MDYSFFNQQLQWVRNASQNRFYPSIVSSAEEYDTKVSTRTPKQDWHFLSATLGFWNDADRPNFILSLDETSNDSDGGYLVLEFISTELTPNFYNSLGVLGQQDMDQVAENEFLRQLASTLKKQKPEFDLQFIPRLFLLVKVSFTSNASASVQESIQLTNLFNNLGGSASLSSILPVQWTQQTQEVTRINAQLRTRNLDQNNVAVTHILTMLDPTKKLYLPELKNKVSTFAAIQHDPFSLLSSKTETVTSSRPFPMAFGPAPDTRRVPPPSSAAREADEYAGDHYLSSAADGDEDGDQEYARNGKARIKGDSLGYFMDPNKRYDIDMRIQREGADLNTLSKQEREIRKQTEWAMTKYVAFWFVAMFFFLLVFYVASQHPSLNKIFVNTFTIAGYDMSYARLVGYTAVFAGFLCFVIGLSAELQGIEALNLAYSGSVVMIAGIFLAMMTFIAKANTSRGLLEETTASVIQQRKDDAEARALSSASAPSSSSSSSFLAEEERAIGDKLRQTREELLQRDAKTLEMADEKMSKEMHGNAFIFAILHNMHRGKIMPFYIQNKHTIKQVKVLEEGKQPQIVQGRILGRPKRNYYLVYLPEWVLNTNSKLVEPIVTVYANDVHEWAFASQLDSLLTRIPIEKIDDADKAKVEDVTMLLQILQRNVKAGMSAEDEDGADNDEPDTEIGLLSSEKKADIDGRHLASHTFVQMLHLACSSDSLLSVDREIENRDVLWLNYFQDPTQKERDADENSGANAQWIEKRFRKRKQGSTNASYQLVLKNGGALDGIASDAVKGWNTGDEEEQEEEDEEEDDDSRDGFSLMSTINYDNEVDMMVVGDNESNEPQLTERQLINRYCMTDDSNLYKEDFQELKSWKHLTTMLDSYYHSIAVDEEEILEEEEAEENVGNEETEEGPEIMQAPSVQAGGTGKDLPEEFDELKVFLVDIFGKLSFCQQSKENIVTMNLAFYLLLAINLFVPLVQFDEMNDRKGEMNLRSKLELITTVMYPTAKLFWLMVPQNEDFEETVIRSMRKLDTETATDNSDKTGVNRVCDDIFPNEEYPLHRETPTFPTLSRIRRHLRLAAANAADQPTAAAAAAATAAPPAAATEQVKVSAAAQKFEDTLHKVESEFMNAKESANSLLGLWSTLGKQNPQVQTQVLAQASQVLTETLNPATYTSLFENAHLSPNTVEIVRRQQELRLRQAERTHQKVSRFANHVLSKTELAASARKDYFFLEDTIAFRGKYTLNQRIFQSAIASLTDRSWLTPEEMQSDQYKEASAEERERFRQDRQRAILLHVCKVISLCMETILFCSQGQPNQQAFASAESVYWFYRPLQITLQSILCDNIRQVYQETYDQKILEVIDVSKDALKLYTRAVKDPTVFPVALTPIYWNAALYDQQGNRRKNSAAKSPLFFYLTNLQTVRLLSVPITDTQLKSIGFEPAAVKKMNPENSFVLIPMATPNQYYFHLMLRTPVALDTEVHDPNHLMLIHKRWTMFDLHADALNQNNLTDFMRISFQNPQMRRGLASIYATNSRDYKYEIAPEMALMNNATAAAMKPTIWKLFADVKKLVNASPIFRGDSFLMMVLSNAFYVLIMKDTQLEDYQGLNWFFSFCFIEWFLFTNMAMLSPIELISSFNAESGLADAESPLMGILLNTYPRIRQYILSNNDNKQQQSSHWILDNDPSQLVFQVNGQSGITTKATAFETASLSSTREMLYRAFREKDQNNYFNKSKTIKDEDRLTIFTIFGYLKVSNYNDMIVRLLADMNVQTSDKGSTEVVREIIHRFFSKNSSLLLSLYNNVQTKQTDLGLLLLLLENSNSFETDRGTFLRHGITNQLIMEIIVKHLSPYHQLIAERMPPDLANFAIHTETNQIVYLFEKKFTAHREEDVSLSLRRLQQEIPACFVMNVGNRDDFLLEADDHVALMSKLQRLENSDLVHDINQLPLLFHERVELLRLFVRAISFLSPKVNLLHFEPSVFMDFARCYLAIITVSFALDNPYFARGNDSDSNSNNKKKGIQYFMDLIVPFSYTISEMMLRVMGNDTNFQSFVKETKGVFSLARSRTELALTKLKAEIANASMSIRALNNLKDAAEEANVGKDLSADQQATLENGRRLTQEMYTRLSKLKQREQDLTKTLQDYETYAIQEQQQIRYSMSTLAVAINAFSSSVSDYAKIKQSVQGVTKSRAEITTYIQCFFYFMYAFSDLEFDNGEWKSAYLNPSLPEDTSNKNILNPTFTRDKHMQSQLHHTIFNLFPLVNLSIGQQIMQLNLSFFSSEMLRRMQLIHAMYKDDRYKASMSRDTDIVSSLSKLLQSELVSKKIDISRPLVIERHATVVDSLMTFFKPVAKPVDDLVAADEPKDAPVTSRLGGALRSLMYGVSAGVVLGFGLIGALNMAADVAGSMPFMGGAGGIISGTEERRKDELRNKLVELANESSASKTAASSEFDKQAEEDINFVFRKTGVQSKILRYRESVRTQLQSYKWNEEIQRNILQSLFMNNQSVMDNLFTLMQGLEWNAREFSASLLEGSFLTSAYRVQPDKATHEAEIVTLRIKKQFLNKYEYRQDHFEEFDPQRDLLIENSGLFMKEQPWIFSSIIYRLADFPTPIEKQALGFMFAILDTPNEVLRLRRKVGDVGQQINALIYQKMFLEPEYIELRWALHQYVMCFLTVYWLNHVSRTNHLFSIPIVYECMMRAFTHVIHPYVLILADPENPAEVEYMELTRDLLSPIQYNLQFRNWQSVQQLAQWKATMKSMNKEMYLASFTEDELSKVYMQLSHRGALCSAVYSMLWTLPPSESKWKWWTSFSYKKTTDPTTGSISVDRAATDDEIRPLFPHLTSLHKDLAQNWYLFVFYNHFKRLLDETTQNGVAELIVFQESVKKAAAAAPTITSISLSTLLSTCFYAMRGEMELRSDVREQVSFESMANGRKQGAVLRMSSLGFFFKKQMIGELLEILNMYIAVTGSAATSPAKPFSLSTALDFTTVELTPRSACVLTIAAYNDHRGWDGAMLKKIRDEIANHMVSSTKHNTDTRFFDKVDKVPGNLYLQLLGPVVSGKLQQTTCMEFYRKRQEVVYWYKALSVNKKKKGGAIDEDMAEKLNVIEGKPVQKWFEESQEILRGNEKYRYQYAEFEEKYIEPYRRFASTALDVKFISPLIDDVKKMSNCYNYDKKKKFSLLQCFVYFEYTKYLNEGRSDYNQIDGVRDLYLYLRDFYTEIDVEKLVNETSKARQNKQYSPYDLLLLELKKSDADYFTCFETEFQQTTENDAIKNVGATVDAVTLAISTKKNVIIVARSGPATTDDFLIRHEIIVDFRYPVVYIHQIEKGTYLPLLELAKYNTPKSFNLKCTEWIGDHEELIDETAQYYEEKNISSVTPMVIDTDREDDEVDEETLPEMNEVADLTPDEIHDSLQSLVDTTFSCTLVAADPGTNPLVPNLLQTLHREESKVRLEKFMNTHPLIEHFDTTDSSLEAMQWKSTQKQRGDRAVLYNKNCRVFCFVPNNYQEKAAAAAEDLFVALQTREQDRVNRRTSEKLFLRDAMHILTWQQFMFMRWELLLVGRRDLVLEIEDTAFVSFKKTSTPIALTKLLRHGTFVDLASSEDLFFFEEGMALNNMGDTIQRQATFTGGAGWSFWKKSDQNKKSDDASAADENPFTKLLKNVVQTMETKIYLPKEDLAIVDKSLYENSAAIFDAKNIQVVFPPWRMRSYKVSAQRLMWYNLVIQIQQVKSKTLRQTMFDTLEEVLKLSATNREPTNAILEAIQRFVDMLVANAKATVAFMTDISRFREMVQRRQIENLAADFKNLLLRMLEKQAEDAEEEARSKASAVYERQMSQNTVFSSQELQEYLEFDRKVTPETSLLAETKSVGYKIRLDTSPDKQKAVFRIEGISYAWKLELEMWYAYMSGALLVDEEYSLGTSWNANQVHLRFEYYRVGHSDLSFMQFRKTDRLNTLVRARHKQWKAAFLKNNNNIADLLSQLSKVIAGTNRKQQAFRLIDVKGFLSYEKVFEFLTKTVVGLPAHYYRYLGENVLLEKTAGTIETYHEYCVTRDVHSDDKLLSVHHPYTVPVSLQIFQENVESRLKRYWLFLTQYVVLVDSCAVGEQLFAQRIQLDECCFFDKTKATAPIEKPRKIKLLDILDLASMSEVEIRTAAGTDREKIEAAVERIRKYISANPFLAVVWFDTKRFLLGFRDLSVDTFQPLEEKVIQNMEIGELLLRQLGLLHHLVCRKDSKQGPEVESAVVDKEVFQFFIERLPLFMTYIAMNWCLGTYDNEQRPERKEKVQSFLIEYLVITTKEQAAAGLLPLWIVCGFTNPTDIASYNSTKQRMLPGQLSFAANLVAGAAPDSKTMQIVQGFFRNMSFSS